MESDAKLISCPETLEIQEINSFEELEIRSEVLQSINRLGLKVKTVHRYALSLMINKQNLLVISPSGLGRGSSTMIGILNAIDLNNPSTQALVLSPNKKLSAEYFKQLNELIGSQSITSVLCVKEIQLDKSSLKSQIIVGTCGRIKQNLEERKIVFKDLKVIVCDVACKLFTEPMLEDTQYLLNQINRRCIYWFLSPENTNNIKEKYLARVGNFGIIEIVEDDKPLTKFNFFLKPCVSQEDLSEFLQSLSYHRENQTIIYSRSVEVLVNLYEVLQNYSSSLLTKKFSDRHNEAVLKDFEKEVVKVLLVQSAPSLLRKIKSRRKVDLVFLDIGKNIKNFKMRLRRFDYNDQDEVFFVVLEDQVEETKRFTSVLDIKLEVF